MITEKNKATRIMKELIGYFLAHQYYQFDVSFHLDDDKFELAISTPSDDVPTHFDHLLSDLCLEREVETDEYFNALLGGHSADHDYTLLGKAIDEANITLSEGVLTLQICRYIHLG